MCEYLISWNLTINLERDSKFILTWVSWGHFQNDESNDEILKPFSACHFRKWECLPEDCDSDWDSDCDGDCDEEKEDGSDPKDDSCTEEFCEDDYSDDEDADSPKELS